MLPSEDATSRAMTNWNLLLWTSNNHQHKRANHCLELWLQELLTLGHVSYDNMKDGWVRTYSSGHCW